MEEQIMKKLLTNCKKSGKRVSFKDLCDLVSNVDYLNNRSYPFWFSIDNNNKESRVFKCGIGYYVGYEDWFQKIYGEPELQYLWEDGVGIVDLQDPDAMSYGGICEMLKEKCKIDNESVITILRFGKRVVIIKEEDISPELKKTLNEVYNFERADNEKY